jgi:hypothetical protein
VVGDPETEVAIVRKRAGDLMADYRVEAQIPDDLVKVLVTVFQELRQGRTLDGQTKVKSPSTPLSTAEAISVLFNGCILASSFGDGRLGAGQLARSLQGVVVREDAKDAACLVEYLETVARKRGGPWGELYESRGLFGG